MFVGKGDPRAGRIDRRLAVPLAIPSKRRHETTLIGTFGKPAIAVVSKRNPSAVGISEFFERLHPVGQPCAISERRDIARPVTKAGQPGGIVSVTGPRAQGAFQPGDISRAIKRKGGRPIQRIGHRGGRVVHIAVSGDLAQRVGHAGHAIFTIVGVTGPRATRLDIGGHAVVRIVLHFDTAKLGRGHLGQVTRQIDGKAGHTARRFDDRFDVAHFVVGKCSASARGSFETFNGRAVVSERPGIAAGGFDVVKPPSQRAGAFVQAKIEPVVELPGEPIREFPVEPAADGTTLGIDVFQPIGPSFGPGRY